MYRPVLRAPALRTRRTVSNRTNALYCSCDDLIGAHSRMLRWRLRARLPLPSLKNSPGWAFSGELSPFPRTLPAPERYRESAVGLPPHTSSSKGRRFSASQHNRPRFHCRSIYRTFFSCFEHWREWLLRRCRRLRFRVLGVQTYPFFGRRSLAWPRIVFSDLRPHSPSPNTHWNNRLLWQIARSEQARRRHRISQSHE